MRTDLWFSSLSASSGFDGSSLECSPSVRHLAFEPPASQCSQGALGAEVRVGAAGWVGAECSGSPCQTLVCEADSPAVTDW